MLFEECHGEEASALAIEHVLVDEVHRSKSFDFQDLEGLPLVEDILLHE